MITPDLLLDLVRERESRQKKKDNPDEEHYNYDVDKCTDGQPDTLTEEEKRQRLTKPDGDADIAQIAIGSATLVGALGGLR